MAGTHEHGKTGNSQGRNKKKQSWLKENVAFVLSAVAALALLSTQLVTIGEAFPKIFPFWAPFNASIQLRDIRVEKVTPSQKAFGGSTAEPAVEVRLEYVEEKTGPSTLKACLPEIRLQDVYPSSNAPQTLEGETQAKNTDVFLIRKQHYSKEGLLRMVCERRITGWLPFQLPEMEGDSAVKPTVTTFGLCAGQYREACQGAANWAPCYTHPLEWAKATYPKECVNAQFQQLSSVGGNRCGYTTYQITCSSK